MSEPIYYTVVVTLIGDSADKPVLYRNLTKEQLDKLQERIWQFGLKRTINATTIEWICPLIIHKVIVKEQTDGYYTD